MLEAKLDLAMLTPNADLPKPVEKIMLSVSRGLRGDDFQVFMPKVLMSIDRLSVRDIYEDIYPMIRRFPDSDNSARPFFTQLIKSKLFEDKVQREELLDKLTQHEIKVLAKVATQYDVLERYGDIIEWGMNKGYVGLGSIATFGIRSLIFKGDDSSRDLLEPAEENRDVYLRLVKAAINANHFATFEDFQHIFSRLRWDKDMEIPTILEALKDTVKLI